MIVDFHCHSTASDGTCTPRELVEKAVECGFSALALTDHDNCDGVSELLSVPSEGCKIIPGIELSIEPGEHFEKFHLLGLGIDPENLKLKSLLNRILEGRNERNEKILENFKRLGFAMDERDELGTNVFDYAHGDILARPHFAQWLIDRGHIGSVKEAFRKYLLSDSPSETRCYEERWHPPQEETFEAIHDAGGLCVMAHPKFWRNQWKYSEPNYVDVEHELARLKEVGLDGVEAIYQANRPSETYEFLRLSVKLGYLVTAGSDFHGATKPNVTFGMSIAESTIKPLFDALNERQKWYNTKKIKEK